MPDSPDFDFGSGAFAFSFWLKLDGENPWRDLFHWSNAAGDDFALQTDAERRLVLYARLDGSGSTVATTSAGVLTPGAWQHVAVTRATGQASSASTSTASRPASVSRRPI